jgi:hypothetical protein
MTTRTYRAGSAIEDYCRACKVDRIHTVVAADISGAPLRVTCGFCRSEHNYRGGPRTSSDPSSFVRRGSLPGISSPEPEPQEAPAREAFPIVSVRERSAPPIMVTDNTGPDARSEDLETLLRRVIREEAGITAVAPAEKWRGGTFVLRPGSPGLQEKSWPIETFFHKVVMLRNRLRTLEQQVNASDLPDDVKVKLQGYVSGCYGTLTTFNVLFADEDDQFKGSGD